MALADTIRRGTTAALKAANSMAVSAYYVKTGDTDHTNYDAASGALTVEETKIPISVHLFAMKQEERDDSGLTSATKKAVFDRKGFSAAVDSEDTIEIREGPDEGAWEVVGILSEAAEAFYSLAIRRP